MDSFPAAEAWWPEGLAWDGEYLWNASEVYDDIYKLDPSTGLVVDWFPSPDRGSIGLAWDGEYLWNADCYSPTIYKLDPETGAVVDSFPSPGTGPMGLAWDGEYLWNADRNTDIIYKIDPSTGVVISSFPSPGSGPFGLTWDGEYLWNADWSFGQDNGTIYKIYVGSIGISATIDIDPDTLNLKSKGKWITCYIELPQDNDVGDIDVGTVMLNGIVPAEARPTEVGDYDEDSIPDLMVKFDRASVGEILEPGDEVEITVTGDLTDGASFSGTDTIRVIDKEKGKAQAEGQVTPTEFTLFQNYPNPFNPKTTVEYSIAEDSDVALKIHNLSGQLIRTLVDEYQTAGHYTVIWHGDNDAGQEIASGVYFYRLQAGDSISTKKMVVLK